MLLEIHILDFRQGELPVVEVRGWSLAQGREVEIHNAALRFVTGPLGLAEGSLQLPRLVDDEYSFLGYAHAFVGHYVVGPVSISGEERSLAVEQPLESSETADLEDLRLLVDDLLLEGPEHGLRVKEERADREAKGPLVEAPEVVPGGPRLGDGSGGQVEDLVTILTDFGEQSRHLLLGPVVQTYKQGLILNYLCAHCTGGLER